MNPPEEWYPPPREPWRYLARRGLRAHHAGVGFGDFLGADTVGAGSRGYDAGKKINGRKRHIVVDTTGLLLIVLVTAASVQDRDGGRRVLDRVKMAMPSLACVFADGGYTGKLLDWARRIPRMVLEIVRKPEGQRGFAVLPRRWVVERTLSWLTAHRAPGPRLRAPARAFPGVGQVGHDRTDGPPLAPVPGRKPWT